jgi:signal transduction histidine kinase
MPLIFRMTVKRHPPPERSPGAMPGQWRPGLVLAGLVLVGLLTWFWQQTRSVSPEEHARIDSTLRELRSLDRTINQDVLRARYQLIPSFDPVRRSYRRIEELETQIAILPRYLDKESRRRLSVSIANYSAAITAKQGLIESFKYRSTELKELLAYLPGAGTGVAAAAADNGDERLLASVNRVLQQTLFYNLTSDERYAPEIRNQVEALSHDGAAARTHLVRRRIRTLVLNIRTLLDVKPLVDQLLLQVFASRINEKEEAIANIYYAGYAAAERTASHYRITLYIVSVLLLLLVANGIRRLRLTARDLAATNERLEERVAERTQALDRRNHELGTVLDSVEQALFTVDLDGRLSVERSAALDRWFPNAVAGLHLWTLLEDIDPRMAAWVQMGWEQLREESMPASLVLAQLPARTTFRNRCYEFAFRPICNAGSDADAPIDKVMVVISDVTESVERARAEADQRENMVIFRELMRDRPAFLEFFAECQRLIGSVAEAKESDGAEGRAAVFRAVHTLKASSGMYGLSALMSLCHQLESQITETDGELDVADLQQLTTAWAAFSHRVSVLTGVAGDDQVAVLRGDLRDLRGAIVAGASPERLLSQLRDLEREPAESRFERLREDAAALARRLGKGAVKVTTEVAGNVRFDRQRWAAFWAAFAHTIRNALDHGLELTSDRVAVGKPAEGQLWLRARRVEEDVVIELADDGRGIDWEAVRARAHACGIGAESNEELLQALFHGGVSTNATTTELSGRGVGVSASYQACLALGGRVEVTTVCGQGTTFRFLFPDEAGSPHASPQLKQQVTGQPG